MLTALSTIYVTKREEIKKKGIKRPIKKKCDNKENQVIITQSSRNHQTIIKQSSNNHQIIIK